jgi:NAD(P)-dependent dehydrogenase (short-subunit alcohol dehydrogenase family)
VPELRRTAEGFELQFGTNDLGPFALTKLLLCNVIGRVVTVASQAERLGRIDFDLPGNSFAAPSHLGHMRGAPELIGRSAAAQDPQMAARLWSLSEQLTGTQFHL